MLDFVRPKASERKLRLFACVCCRGIWHLLGAEDRLAVERAEALADGRTTPAEVYAAFGPRSHAATRAAAQADAFGGAADAARIYANAVAAAARKDARRLRAALVITQAALLRDLFAPFSRASVAVAW